MQGRLALAQASLKAANYRSAQAYAAEALALDPNEATALAIQREAAAVLARFDAAVTLARQRLAGGDLQETSRALATARDIDPTAPAVLEISAALARQARDIEVSSQRKQRAPTETRPSAPAAAPSASTSPRAAEQTRASQVPERPASPAPPSTDVVERTVPPRAPPTAAPPAPQTAAQSGDVRPPVAEVPRPTPADARDAAPVPERPAVPVVDDNAAIRRVVAEYGRAIESKDVALFRSLKPNLSREEERRLQEGFRAVTSQRVGLTVVSLEIREQTASVVVQRRDTATAAGRQQTVESRQTFRLTRAVGGWVIEDIR